MIFAGRLTSVLLAVAACCASLPVHAQGAKEPASAPSDGPKFEIRRFVFDGAKLVPLADLEEATKSFSGKERSFADVQRALEAIEKIYSLRGYSAVQVILPEQELEKGEVRFTVIEAKLGRLLVEGNKFFSEANIRASLPSLSPGQAPNINDVARNLRIANENPSKQTTVLLRSGQEEATVDAVARVVDEAPTRASVTVDTTGNVQTGRLRVGMGFQHGNFLERDHVLTLQYVGAPYEQVDSTRLSVVPSPKVFVFGAGYRIPLYESGNAIDITAGYSTVNSGTVANLFSISGAGGIFGARYTKNLQKIGDYEHKAVFSWDFRGYQNKGVRAVGSTFQLVPDVTVHPIGLTYSGVMRGQDNETGGSISVSQNLPGGNDARWENLCASRSNGIGECARGAYQLWTWSLNHTRAFSNDFQMRFAMNGQQTRDMLISGEQFGAGGADSVRGFFSREVSNDTGYRGTFELYSPDWGGKTGLAGLRARGLFFVDWAGLRRNRPGPAESHSQHISSVGFGLRLSQGTSASLRVDYAVVSQPGGNQGRGDGRLHASFSYVF